MATAFARFALSLSLTAFLPLGLGCTNGMPEAEALPSSELPAHVLYGFAVEGEAKAEALPPLGRDMQLAGDPAHDRFAVSDGRRLFVSEGELLRERPRSYASEDQIEAMAMDAAGTLWLLLSDNRLQQVDTKDQLHDAGPLPLRASSLHAGGGYLVILGEALEAHPLPPAPAQLSEDPDEEVWFDEYGGMAAGPRGRPSSRGRRPDDGSELDDLAIDAKGRVWLMDGDERSCGGGEQERYSARLDRPGWRMMSWDYDYPSSRFMAPGGWTYVEGYGEECGADTLCGVSPKGAIHELTQLPGTHYDLIQQGGQMMLVTSGGLHRLDGRGHARIGEGLPQLRHERASASALSGGRALVVIDDELFVSFRADEGQGWRSLALADTP